LNAGAVFFRAWTIIGSQLCVDMVTARSIWREHIREARAPLLAALDVEYLRAEEQEDSKRKAAIAARKQRLRDAPSDPAIENAETIASLREVWPLDGDDS
ncbi:hypothetical protein, partial [Vineibacter terrae]|uniref:hypothetical protein n=1 Tax=Vineibacter terrae TaxID=2586908 RepID=UPI002E33C63B